MRSLLSRAIQIDPSFHLGLTLVVLLAAAEIFAVILHYASRSSAGRITTLQTLPAAQPRAAATVAPPPAAAVAQPRPSQPATVGTPLPSLAEQLMREGVQLRDRGDTTTALQRFDEALDSEPDNVGVLLEKAKTYDAMQLYDRANEIWRKIRDISPSDSAAYRAADQRLKLGVSSPGAAVEGAPAANAPPAAAPPRDVAGNPEGPVMAITEVQTSQTPDPEAETNLALRIGIKKQPGVAIDHNKVKIYVFLYDTVDDNEVKLTDADVSSEWGTQKHDWTEANPEILMVNYVRPKTPHPSASSSETGQKSRSAKRSAPESGRRKYLGYRILVYYDDKLQAVQAEPGRLLQLYPPPESPSTP